MSEMIGESLYNAERMAEKIKDLEAQLEDARAKQRELERLIDPWADQEWPIVVKLDRPIKVGKHGRELDEIVIREPTMADHGDIRITAEVDLDQIAKMAAKLIDNAPKGERDMYAEKLPVKAAGVAMRVARGFITACL